MFQPLKLNGLIFLQKMHKLVSKKLEETVVFLRWTLKFSKFKFQEKVKYKFHSALKPNIIIHQKIFNIKNKQACLLQIKIKLKKDEYIVHVARQTVHF